MRLRVGVVVIVTAVLSLCGRAAMACANYWVPSPDAELTPEKIQVGDGEWFIDNSQIKVVQTDNIFLMAASVDFDTLTNVGQYPDVPHQIVWSTTGGTLSASRVNSGVAHRMDGSYGTSGTGLPRRCCDSQAGR